MLSHLSLSVCLITISVQPPTPEAGQPYSPAPAPTPAFGPGPGQAPPAAYGNLGNGSFGPAQAMGGQQGSYCPQCEHRHRYHKPTPFHDWMCPSCNLTQRYPYYPTDHGHYYFRPYHMQRVIEQQAIAVGWGEDPRNPHGQLVFERVYDQIRADQAAKAEPLPVPMPVPPPPMEETGPVPPVTPKAVPPKPVPENDPMLPKPPPAANPPAPNNEEPKNEQSSYLLPINTLRR